MSLYNMKTEERGDGHPYINTISTIRWKSSHDIICVRLPDNLQSKKKIKVLKTPITNKKLNKMVVSKSTTKWL